MSSFPVTLVAVGMGAFAIGLGLLRLCDWLWVRRYALDLQEARALGIDVNLSGWRRELDGLRLSRALVEERRRNVERAERYLAKRGRSL